MGLCKKLNCCRSKGDCGGGKKAGANHVVPVNDDDTKATPKKGDEGEQQRHVDNNNSDEDKNQSNAVNNTDDMSMAKNNGKEAEPVYAKVDKSNKPKAPPLTPVKGGFLVSFVVDSRGGAMTGCRGSGLRIIMPPGAVEQPVRVTCRFIRPTSHQMPFPPPLMERDALASGVIEVGPVGSQFKLPVLIEVPFCASLANGSRELIVLRSDDGETWKEHEMANTSQFLEQNGWIGEEAELYQDVVKSIELSKAADELSTGRILRLSTMSFPKYFALVSRIKGEVQSINDEGGTVKAWTKDGAITVSFPAKALKKKIKIGLQVHSIPDAVVRAVDPQGGILDAYPLIGIYPRRRKFHNAIEVSLPVISESKSKEVKKIWLLCSLSSATEKAVWEDVSESAGVTVKGRRLAFETKVTALFWLFTAKEDYSSEQMLDIASTMYKELLISPYIARMTVFYRHQFPFAWCDALRMYCSVNDKMDTHIEEKDDNWIKVLDGQEIEVDDRRTYNFDIDRSVENDFLLAPDCQIEAKLDDRLYFRAFHDNSTTILVKSRTENITNPSKCSLVMKRMSRLPESFKKEGVKLCSLHLTFPKVQEDVKEDKNEENCQPELKDKKENDQGKADKKEEVKDEQDHNEDKEDKADQEQSQTVDSHEESQQEGTHENDIKMEEVSSNHDEAHEYEVVNVQENDVEITEESRTDETETETKSDYVKKDIDEISHVDEHKQ